MTAEQNHLQADGESLAYVWAEIMDEDGNLVTDAAVKLNTEITGPVELLGFGSGNPITDENYQKSSFTSYQGRALAVLRAGCEKGEIKLTVKAEGFEMVEITLPIQ